MARYVDPKADMTFRRVWGEYGNLAVNPLDGAIFITARNEVEIGGGGSHLIDFCESSDLCDAACPAFGPGAPFVFSIYKPSDIPVIYPNV